jgi:hypothetical protein
MFCALFARTKVVILLLAVFGGWVGERCAIDDFVIRGGRSRWPSDGLADSGKP